MSNPIILKEPNHVVFYKKKQKQKPNLGSRTYQKPIKLALCASVHRQLQRPSHDLEDP